MIFVDFTLLLHYVYVLIDCPLLLPRLYTFYRHVTLFAFVRGLRLRLLRCVCSCLRYTRLRSGYTLLRV